MKPSKELFTLINSLTKSEKRFFKLNSSIQSGEKNYLKIFDYIEKQSEYNEKALKQRFKNETFVKHLPSEKNHLYKLILKSLRLFYSEQSLLNILKEELKNIEILFNKALYKECGKFIKRAKKIAWEYEKFYYLFELISWEKKLIQELYESGVFDVNLNKLIEEETNVIERLRNLAEYQILYSKINALFHSGGFSKNEEEKATVNKIADHHLIKGKNTAISTRATTICYYIKGLCAATNREYKDSYIYFNKVKIILDNHPKLKLDLGKRYVQTLFHLMRCYMDDKNFIAAQKMHNVLNDLKDKKGFDSINLKVKMVSILINEQLNIFNFQGQFEKSHYYLNTIKDELAHYKPMLSKEQIIQLQFNTAYTYFGTTDYKKALFYLNNILNSKSTHLRQDIFNFSRVLNLIIHIELENYDYLEYITKATDRYLNKTERNYNIESTLVKYIKKVAKSITPENRIKIYQQMNDEIQLLLKNHDERVILSYFDVKSWVYGKANNYSLAEAKNKLEQSVKI